MLGCHLESNQTLNSAYFKLQKTNFSTTLSTFVVCIKIAFCMKIHGNSIQKKTACPWKALFLFLFFPLLFTLSRILSPFLLLESIYKLLKCKTKNRIAESVFVAKILGNFQNLNYNLASIGILMIVISNTSILNPGPAKINGLSCYCSQCTRPHHL